MIYMPIPDKQCKKCGKWLPATTNNFHRHREGKFGVNSHCRNCRSVEPLKQIEDLPFGQKRCTKCSQVLPATSHFFNKDGTKTGLMARCRNCQNITVHGKALRVPVEILPDGMKRCTKCKRVLPFDRFNKLKKSDPRLLPSCRDCIATASYKYRQEHPEKTRDYARRYVSEHKQSVAENQQRWKARNPNGATQRTREWRKKNPERSRASTLRHRAHRRNLPSAFAPKDWRHALDYFDNRCAVCGRPQGLWHTLAMDHWIPLSDPECPGTIPTNIIPLCHGIDGCNNSKGNRDAKQWLIEKYDNTKARKIFASIQKYFDSLPK